MASYTQHYQLHQWEPEDHFLRTDFNADFLKIDTALKEKSGSVLGTYTGDGTTNRVIDFGQEVALIIVQGKGWRSNSFNDIGFAAGEGCSAGVSSGSTAFTHTGTGIQLESAYFNNSGSTYSYIALVK